MGLAQAFVLGRMLKISVGFEELSKQEAVGA